MMQRSNRIQGWLVALLVGGLALSGCGPPAEPTAPQGAGEDAGGAATHGPSGFIFPESVGGFRRGEITAYDAQGNDVSAGYNHDSVPITMTVYVYPAGVAPDASRLREHFEQCKGELARHHPDAKLESQGEHRIAPAGAARDGLRASYVVSGESFNSPVPLRSELYLFLLGDNFVKYRVTYAEADRDVAEIAVPAFLDGLAWP
jgi:hypothetical protein